MPSLRTALLRATAGSAFALMLLLLLELALRLAMGAPEPLYARAFWDQDTPAFDVRGQLVQPVFQDADQLHPFKVDPAPNTTRIIFLGGSSVRGGMPHHPEREFPALVGQRLEQRGHQVQAINLGRPALDSEGVLRVVEQLDALRAHIAVVYTGHNDIGNLAMFERYGSASGALGVRVRAKLSHLRLYTVLRDMSGPMVQKGRLSHGPAVSMSQRSLAERAFRTNLEHILLSLRAQGIQPLLVTPIGDTHAAPSSATCPEAWPEHGIRDGPMGLVFQPERPTLEEVEAGLRLHPGCAELLWLRGARARSKGQMDAAWADFAQARERDPIPVRATRAIVQTVRDVAAQEGVPVLDLDAQRPLPPWFKDQVHLSVRGHESVATEIADALEPLLAAP